MTDPTPGLHLNLLGGFELVLDGRIVLATNGSQRLVAFLALHPRLLPRTYVAGVLWPTVTTTRANANLRAGLWRLPASCRLLVEQMEHTLRLAADVVVDFDANVALARRLLDRSQHCAERDLGDETRRALSEELLPTWDEDWVLVARERFRQLRLHALEALCERLTGAGRYGEAVDAGLAAVAAEPLRESAHCILINAHLAEGNQSEAGRQFHLCRRLLRDELGVEPSAALRELATGQPRAADAGTRRTQFRQVALTHQPVSTTGGTAAHW